MLTVGGVSARKGAATPLVRAVSCPLVMPIAFGSPVVPLVNSTRPSRSSTSSAGGGAGIWLVAEQLRRGKCLGCTGFQEPVGVRLPRNSHVGTPGVLPEPPQFRRCESGVHQRGRGADPRGRQHRGDRQQASDVDDRHGPAGHVAGGQAGGALVDGQRQIAVADGAALDDERNAIGVACRGRVDDRSDVHARLNTAVTTRRSAAAGWSTDRAGRARRASTSPGAR